ncbi:MAG: photosynthetic complex putative assembly protein PuhB, partial [Gemmatirosa sp.]
IPGFALGLPRGERLLWVGAPRAARVARDAVHVRALAAYFVALLLAPGAFAAAGSSRLAAIATAAVWVVPLGVSTVLFARALGTLVARTTVYAITDRRVVLRLGIALPMTFNIPLRTIAAVDVRARGDGTGDVSLELSGEVRIAYLLLWPHARPWCFARPRPMLRAIEGATDVAGRLAAAIRAESAPAPESVAGARAGDRTRARRGAGAPVDGRLATRGLS